MTQITGRGRAATVRAAGVATLDMPWGCWITRPCRRQTEWSVGTRVVDRMTQTSVTQGPDRALGPVETMLAADQASRGLGIELLEHGTGRAVVRMTVTAAMVNGHRIAHGGFLFLLADTAFACACNSHGPVTVAAGADIEFVAPAHLGDVLVATARERVRYGRNGVYDVTVLRGDEVIAEFRGRSRDLRTPAPPAAAPYPPAGGPATGQDGEAGQ